MRAANTGQVGSHRHRSAHPSIRGRRPNFDAKDDNEAVTYQVGRPTRRDPRGPPGTPSIGSSEYSKYDPGYRIVTNFCATFTLFIHHGGTGKLEHAVFGQEQLEELAKC